MNVSEKLTEQHLKVILSKAYKLGEEKVSLQVSDLIKEIKQEIDNVLLQTK